MMFNLQPAGKSEQLEMTGKSSERITRVLIISHPGMMQNVLRDTFSSRADVDVVGVASGGLSAVAMIKHRQPDLVVIDSNLPEVETCKLIEWIKEEHQSIRTLVLAETTQQLNRAANTGADYALRSYSLLDNLNQVLGSLSSNLRTKND